MTVGIDTLSKTQIGREATAGTAVPATTILRTKGGLDNTMSVVFPEENIGYVSGTDRQYVPFKGGTWNMPAGEASFEQLNHVFEAGIKKVTTGAADGSGSGKIYAYALPTTQACDMSSSTRVIQPYTIENGDNNEVEEMEYSFVESFTIEGKATEALMVSAVWKGRQISNSSFTTSATLPTVEEILFSKGSVYIDAVGGTLGATQVSNTILDAKVDVKTGLKGQPTADGNLYFSFVKGVVPEVLLTVSFEHNGSASSEKTNWETGVARQIRLKFLGSSLTTAGSSYSTKALVVDLAGKWEKFSVRENRDGNSVVTGTFRARYNSTAALFARFTLVNTLANVP